MIEKKYAMTDEVIEYRGIKLHRIRALRDFGDIKAGELGGFIQREENLDHGGYCWVWKYAKAYENAAVMGDAQIKGQGEVCESGKIMGDSQIFDIALVCGNAVVNDSVVKDEAVISGNSYINDSIISGSSSIANNSKEIQDSEDSKDSEDSCVLIEKSQVSGPTEILDASVIIESQIAYAVVKDAKILRSHIENLDVTRLKESHISGNQKGKFEIKNGITFITDLILAGPIIHIN